MKCPPAKKDKFDGLDVVAPVCCPPTGIRRDRFVIGQVEMRVVNVKYGLIFKLLLLWFLAVVLVLFIYSYCQVRTDVGGQARANRPTAGSPSIPDPLKEATKMVGIRLTDEQRQVLQRVSEKKLERLQFFPKAEQLNLLNMALANRPELKSFLVERFNVSDGTGVLRSVPLGRYAPARAGRGAAVPKLNTRYVLTPRAKCHGKAPFVLVLVHSRWDGADRRSLIRETWARIASFRGHEIRVVFLLGMPPGDSRQTASDAVQREHWQSDDILQGDFVDDYRNLTVKHLMGYHWTLRHCQSAQFVVKMDDDVIVNTFHLIDFLASSANVLLRQKTDIYCSAFVNQGPLRNRADKWYVDRSEYPDDKYPTYCEGFAYVTTTDVVRRIYRAALVVEPFWIDDVYVTGILAKATGVGHSQFRQPYGYAVIDRGWSKKRVQNVLFFLQKYVKDEEMWRWIWKQIVEVHRAELYTVNSRYLNMKPPPPPSHGML